MKPSSRAPVTHGVVIFLILAGTSLSASGAESLLGFSDAGSTQQRAAERRFDAALRVEDLDEWMRALSARPHHLGSSHGRANVEYLAGLFESWGYEVELARYQVLLPTPTHRRLRLVEPVEYEAVLRETSLAEDPSTAATDELLPPYNAFSRDGDVTAELVFVNYGVQEDYELLERHGIDVAGKIVIAKYGHSWRGIKPKLAADHGAIGALIYSDPADDGYAQGDVYPTGAFKHASGVQRGSVMELPVFAGDVLTPGIAATRRARRLDREDASAITRIPVLPISYADAQPLLTALGGAVAPDEWRGALPITYHLGPGPAKVRLEVAFSWDLVEARNVIARLEGHSQPERWVIRGNHHDGWNHGAGDPVSGLVAMLAEAKAVAQSGQRPARTLIYAAWDAEEPGLIGSTEWVEQHARELTRQAVAYFNTDGTGRGFLNLGGSSTLERFFDEIAAEVLDPRAGVSLAARRTAWVKVAGSERLKAQVEQRGSLRLAPLGSGSDFTPFLQHLGIASANLGFRGESRGGSYHTAYDTHAHYTRFIDPGFVYGVVLAGVAGRATLRMANAEVLPFDFEVFADNLGSYVDEVVALTDELREQTAATNALLDDGSYALALDPEKPLGPPKRYEAVPHLNFAPLHNAMARLTAAARDYRAAADEAPELSDSQRAALNDLLFMSERLLLKDSGLPGRPWYRHWVYAPGYYTGYGVKTLPAVREPIEQRDFEQVDAAIIELSGVFEAFTNGIERATAIWRNATPTQ